MPMKPPVESVALRRPNGAPRRGLGRALVLALSLAGGAATTSASRPAQASIVVAMDLSDLVKRAEHIVLVDVLSKQADWDSKHERILSTIELKVVERWKGQTPTGGAEERITVVQPGGTVGDLTMTVTGLSAFAPGERALLFLTGTTQNAHVLGMSQGKRAVRFDTSSQRWIVHAPDLRQTTVVRPRISSPSGTAAAPLQRTVPAFREAALDD